ncbi:MAG TPA: hypothetical protein VJ583_01990 [Nitrososphaeraceae archaeon]|nr:hypothetical protein [Nitrososphaeraceae archaeon]
MISIVEAMSAGLSPIISNIGDTWTSLTNIQILTNFLRFKTKNNNYKIMK